MRASKSLSFVSLWVSPLGVDLRDVFPPLQAVAVRGVEGGAGGGEHAVGLMQLRGEVVQAGDLVEAAEFGEAMGCRG